MKKEDLIEYKKKIAELSDKEKKLRDLYLKQLADGTLQGPPVGYPSVDKPWLQYYNYDFENTNIPDKSMYQMAYDSNKNNMNSSALELRTSNNGFKKGVVITYNEYFKKIKQAAKAFKKLGVKEKEIVPIILPNLPESRIIIYALNMIGAIVYPINFMLSSNDLKNIIDDNKISNIIIFDGFYGKYQDTIDDSQIKNVIHVNGLESLPGIIKKAIEIKNKKNNLKLSNKKNNLTYDKFIINGLNNSEVVPYYEKDNTAVIIGTSGTTGTPKGVCLTNEQMNAISMQHLLAGLFEQNENFLDVLIQSIGYGMSAAHFSTCAGLNSILIPELVTNDIASLICKIKPDHFLGGPVHCINIANSNEFNENKIPKLKNFVSGGASLDKSIEKKLNNIDCNYVENKSGDELFVRQGFGATENGGCGTYCTKGSYACGSIGVSLPLDTVAIFELGTDKELSYGEIGEICISGPTIMKEYLNDKIETDNVLKEHSDGTKWLHIADLGYCDEHGRLYHSNRAKNIFMRNGFNVHPSKIKDFICSFPFIKECAVIGFKHSKEQMVPVAFVEFESGYDSSMQEYLLNILKNKCYENLDECFIPFDWKIVQSMPHNLGGKIDEKLLKEQINLEFIDINDISKSLNKCK